MTGGPVTLLNTGLPLALLSLLAVLLPRLLLPAQTRSHRRLVGVLGASVVLVLAAGCGVFAALKLVEGADLGGAFRAAPGLALGALLRPAALAAIAWGPILALSGLSLTHRIEDLRGQDMRRGQ